MFKSWKKSLSQQAKNQSGYYERKKALRFGALAEFFIANILKLKLYKIIARNYKLKSGEVDIIAKKGKTIIFVEVKSRTRQREGDNNEVLSENQKRRIAKSAQQFLVINRKKYHDYDIRFDLFIFRNIFDIQHIKNAWDASIF